MPKIQLDIPPHIHKKLKEAARSEARSLTNFITYHIGELADPNYNKLRLPEGWEIINNNKNEKEDD